MNILFHICCSNCAVFPFKIITGEGHSFAGLWYNPNIHPFEEYHSRLESLKRLSDLWKVDVCYTEEYTPQDFFMMFPPLTKGGSGGVMDAERMTEGLSLHSIPPFPDRCASCYRLRLEKTAEHAKKQGHDAFSTTLFISPYQDFDRLVSIGNELADKYGIMFYFKDFRPWFREAMKEAGALGLYRQKYCGCIFSREERFNKAGTK